MAEHYPLKTISLTKHNMASSTDDQVPALPIKHLPTPSQAHPLQPDAGPSPPSTPARELRCKMCRRILAHSAFVEDHQPPVASTSTPSSPTPPVCPHVFIEPLSWMSPELEASKLEGRLTCPNERCGANIGRYSWRGFRCSCGQWVTPAFSLQRSKVDEGAWGGEGAGAGGGGQKDRTAAATRLPPQFRLMN